MEDDGKPICCMSAEESFAAFYQNACAASMEIPVSAWNIMSSA